MKDAHSKVKLLLSNRAVTNINLVVIIEYYNPGTSEFPPPINPYDSKIMIQVMQSNMDINLKLDQATSVAKAVY